MAMYALSQFLLFEMNRFQEGKKLMVLSCSPWVDYETKEKLGQKTEVVIIEDKTPYKPAKDGSVKSNLYEKMNVKTKKDISLPIGSIVELIGAKGEVYGDYRNQLSVTAEDIRVVSQTGGKAV